MSMNKWLQELIVMDIFKQTFTFTIWDQTIMDNEGNKLLQQLHEYPIILARRIGGSRYNGVSLTTKFNTTILIDPPYAQKQQLRAWITENKPTLTSFTLRSTSKSGALISIPVDEEVILIANAESQQDGQTFSIEAKISFPADQKKYYVLVCSNCGQDVRYPIIMQIHCVNCGQHKMLIPRCRFNVNLEDNSGTTTGMIMNKEAEKLLSLTAEQIYERTSTKISTQALSTRSFLFGQKKHLHVLQTQQLQNYISSRAWKRNTPHILLQH
ncbi:hypothetical protein AABB24_021316 [Solanum stoloniferum]|uniref:Replication factor A C-terminal domain-containing protein n=1 Tax=Solanum stoloniferum TaxID=62892 RepID=A0ABD2SUT3_9SOLN